MTRRMRVYHLDVVYPLESFRPNWEPEGWEPLYGEPDQQTFRWPRRKNYFSAAAARERADLLKRWGCTVIIMRSTSITWEAEIDTPLPEEIDAAIVGLTGILNG